MSIRTNIAYKQTNTYGGLPMTLPESVPVVTEAAEEYLNHKHLLNYRSERESCLTWLLGLGKNPEKGEGYAVGTVKPRSYRMSQFYRWVWEQEGGYMANLTHEHAVSAPSREATLNQLRDTGFGNPQTRLATDPPGSSTEFAFAQLES